MAPKFFHRYDAGDHVAVFPVNDSELVEKLGERLNIDLGKAFTLTNVDGKLTYCKQLMDVCVANYHSVISYYGHAYWHSNVILVLILVIIINKKQLKQ